MSKRHNDAITCQSGASNERRIAMALVESIDECRAESASPTMDSATFLILHQLVWVLTGHDMCTGSTTLQRRYEESVERVNQSLKKD